MVAVAQGGLQGAVMGGIFGGARGAAVGGATGAAVGLAGVLLQRGPDLDLPRDMMFEIQLDQPLDVPALSAQRATELASLARQAPPSNGRSLDPTIPVDAEESQQQAPDFSGIRSRWRPHKISPASTHPVNPPQELFRLPQQLRMVRTRLALMVLKSRWPFNW